MMRSAFDIRSACASVLATMNSTPSSPAMIMLLMALPPAPPTPNTMMRAFISRISVMSVMSSSRLLPRSRGMKGCGWLLAAGLAVSRHEVRGQASHPARCARGALDRAARSGAQRAFKPRRRLLGGQGLGGCLQQLDQQAVGAFALAFEIGAVTGGAAFEPRDLGFQRGNPGRQHGRAAGP